MKRLLVVSPDYASHYLPMSAVAHQLGEYGYEVTVATGPGLASRVRADGFGYAELVLGAGSNPGVIRSEDQEREERRRLEGFFAASRQGMVATLRYQAEHRLDDLLWEPGRVAARLRVVLVEVGPTHVLVDQLAFGATAALRGLGQPFIAFHPGHPSALAGDAPYGVPPRIPTRFEGERDGLADLEVLCRLVSARFTERYNQVIHTLDPGAPPVDNAFTATSESLTLVNYPEELAGHYRGPATARMIGWSVPSHRLQTTLDWEPQGPVIYISLGSFFSARDDILQRLVSAFRDRPVSVALATGVTDPSRLGSLPDHWLVETYLRQPALLARADLVITHGGNNSVTEALRAGVPLLVGPLSTDQFAGAADIEEAGLGMAFDPNHDTPADISELAMTVLEGTHPSVASALGERLRDHSGPEIAAELIDSL
ncbi:MAG TPA: nucleotide disphospho-sugar-binding domain-containing protein [Acidimicrobiia bacterium]|nr:nucleotide disphospho-sugar-binding domain-containing protein [Acidimicrobiia bacterium]